MDLIEINKLTQDKKVLASRNALYDNKSLSQNDCTTLVLYACKKMYGLNKTVKIVHGLGVKNL